MKTVGIGSLPHLNISEAISYSLKHTLPFLPQMTSLGERMVEQVLSTQELSTKYKSLSLFTEKIIEQNITTFKIQIAGPETCNVDDKKILLEINNFLKYFENYNLRPIVFIDEPIITFKSEHLKNIFNELTNMKISSGLHSCATFKLEQAEYLKCDFLSYDAGLVAPNLKSKKNLIAGIPPFSGKDFSIYGEWISSSCGLAMYTEEDCEKILINLRAYK
jgi:hypothetical protein